MRCHRTTGLTEEQLHELVARVAERLDDPWDKGVGRPKELSLYEAVAVACAYMRQNIVEEVLAERWGVSQATISRAITVITPVIKKATEEFVRTAEDAVDAIHGAIALVDGSPSPCWSWDGHRELWAGKHRTTGHNFLVITGLPGNVAYISDPLPGETHDVIVLDTTEVAEILSKAGDVIGDKGFQGRGYTTPIKKPQHRELYEREKDYNAWISSLRAPVERAIANIKTWRILHTDYRRPLHTYLDSFRAAVGLYFFTVQLWF